MVTFLSKGYFIIWGYFNHEFRVFNLSSGSLEDSDCLDSKITYLTINKSEDIILIGTSSGLFYVY